MHLWDLPQYLPVIPTSQHNMHASTELTPGQGALGPVHTHMIRYTPLTPIRPEMHNLPCPNTQVHGQVHTIHTQCLSFPRRTHTPVHTHAPRCTPPDVHTQRKGRPNLPGVLSQGLCALEPFLELNPAGPQGPGAPCRGEQNFQGFCRGEGDFSPRFRP